LPRGGTRLTKPHWGKLPQNATPRENDNLSLREGAPPGSFPPKNETQMQKRNKGHHISRGGKFSLFQSKKDRLFQQGNGEKDGRRNLTHYLKGSGKGKSHFMRGGEALDPKRMKISPFPQE